MHEEIPQLLSLIQDANVRDHRYSAAEQALIRLGEKAVPALSEMANDANTVTARRAMEILSKIRASGLCQEGSCGELNENRSATINTNQN